MKDQLSYLSNAELASIEQMYKDFMKDPESVDFGWRKFFEGFEFSRTNYQESGDVMSDKEFKVFSLIDGYRARGHLFTQTNPVRKRRTYKPGKELETFGLSEEDLETEFKAGENVGLGKVKLKDIVRFVEDTYCRSIGAEYMYIRDPKKQNWLKERIEKNRNTPNYSTQIKKHILHKLNQAVGFEQFLHKKYLGQKRFSLEGAESLIPALDIIIEKGAELGAEEFIIGMPHRGRLNVLANILNKSYQEIFSEFEGKGYEDNYSLGDVKYHLGYSADIVTRKGQILSVSLTPNPSHLETVNPVVEGIVRAKLDYKHKMDWDAITPILIHGDAAIAGQGVVYEVAQMAKLKGYRTGGTIHIVINNQVGFTTDYLDARSSTYCTDVAKTTLSPVFHVNGDNPEALAHVIEIAMEYRQEFNNDVYIDLLCYRKHGHNEGDEPRFTQPLLYKAIAKHPDPRKIYSDKLIEEGVITREEFDKMKTQLDDMLQDRLLEARKKGLSSITPIFDQEWEEIKKAVPEDYHDSTASNVKKEKIIELGEKIYEIPEGLKLFNKTKRLLERWNEALHEGTKLDWAICEHLAYATLLSEGHGVRLSGQDVERGTFSHRHAVITCEDATTYTPLKKIEDPEKAKFEIYNSPLNEYGVLGFEYGYAMVYPNNLTIWEAQFGDFNNGAQIIIDQYISSAEDKWKVMNGIVLYLPHGFEGQGPEHSSARIERFLTLCGRLNMQVVNCTTPANFFHVLRRQMKQHYRKPLIIFTPKSLLRHPDCVSPIDDLTTKNFCEVIDDETVKDASKVEKVIFCSGKVFYDLIEEKKKRKIGNVAIVRIEQLYPFPDVHIKNIIEKYSNTKKWLWVQEEPMNMGACGFMKSRFEDIKLHCVGREESGSPAGGLSVNHQMRKQKLMDESFE